MDLFHTTDFDGVSELNPCTKKMHALLDSLDSPEAADSEHPDISLMHDPSGWSIAVTPSGVVTLENIEDPDDAPYFMTGVSRDQALELWLALSRGEIAKVRSHPWQREEN